MEIPEIFTLIKFKVMQNKHLSDKDKAIVCHLLKIAFKECIQVQDEEENGSGIQVDNTDFDIMDFLGGFKK